jgi:hypothetical protein
LLAAGGKVFTAAEGRGLLVSMETRSGQIYRLLAPAGNVGGRAGTADGKYWPTRPSKFLHGYNKTLKKDDKTLNRFSLGYLEHKILSWSVQDIFNKNLFRQQVKYHWSSLISPCLLASCTHVSPFVYMS